MSGHPFFWDIVLIVAVMPLVEAVILRQNYRVLSPVTMFFLGNMTLYVIPYISHFYFSPDWRLNLLSYHQFSVAFNILRGFLYTYCIVIIPLLYRLSKSQPVVMVLDYKQIRNKTMFFFVFACLVVVITLGVGVGFSPALMIDRAIHPREYTYIRAGVGPLTHLFYGVKFILMALASALIFLSGKSVFSIIFFVIAAFVTFLGGTKSSFVLPVFMFVVVWQKMNWRLKSAFAMLRRTLQIGVIAGSLVLSGFLLFPGREFRISGLEDAVAQVVHYNKEPYYLPLVVEYFPWTPYYTYGQIRDTFLAPIPRAIWGSKPNVGLWQNYFRQAFEPTTVFYHTSTFGCLAEAHMMFGSLGPFIYGIIWALICYKFYSYMLTSTSFFKAFMIGIVSFWTYLLLRTGFLEVNFSIMVMYAILGWVFLRNTAVVLEEETEDEGPSVMEPGQESLCDDLSSPT